MLSLKALDEAEISRVYREYMIGTFSDDELIELPMILDLKKKGVCLTLGILDQEELIGYAVLYQDSGGLGLLLGQFYSILPQYRGGGIRPG